MPELPEVETVTQGLIELGVTGQKIKLIKFFRKDLRNVLPVGKVKGFAGAKVLSLSRRAKYILIQTDQGVILSHLGMTGTWRKEVKHKLKDHDHIKIEFSSFSLIYNDPRRFGFFDVFDCLNPDNKYLGHLGPEPLDRFFSGAYLFKLAQGKSLPIKNFIMDQKVVVGVGNIYACEALFQAKINPNARASSVSEGQFKLLVSKIKKVLKAAIKAGGSTISDFRAAGGESGYFQTKFLVYGREGESCYTCESLIQNIKLGGRSSFYCPRCQK